MIHVQHELAANGLQYEGSIYGSKPTNWTPLTVSQNGRPFFFLQLRSDADDGSGPADLVAIAIFGTNGR